MNQTTLFMKGFDMKTFTCANVPEGHFTFDELLDLDLIKDAIAQLKSMPHPQKHKVKTLVFTMQLRLLMKKIMELFYLVKTRNTI